MKRGVFKTFLRLCTVAALSACHAHHGAVNEDGAGRGDSVRTVVVGRVEFVHDTVLTAIPSESHEVTTRDTVSWLETTLAESMARVDADGTLTHTLANKEGSIAVPTEQKVVTRDSVVYVSRPYAVTKTQYVAKPLNPLEKIAVWGFYGLLAVVFGYAAIRKLILKKPLFK